MPERPLRPCSQFPCPNLTKGGYCVDHKRKDTGNYNRGRGSAASHGYGYRWRKYRMEFLARDENRYCAAGCGNPSTDVDHIEPVSGPEDPLFWQQSNHQGLCHSCHSRKTVADGRWGKPKRGGSDG